MAVEDVLAAVADWTAHTDTANKYHDYLDGKHYYPFTGDEARRAREWALNISVLNVCPAVRDAITTHVDVTGWVGDDADILAEYNLDHVIGMTVDEAVGASDAYLHVWPDAAGQLRVLAHRADQAGYLPSAEAPDQARLFYKPIITDDLHGRINLYYPAGVERWVTLTPIGGTATSTRWPDANAAAWRPYDDDGQPPVISYETVGVTGIPWVHVPFRPAGHGERGRSILADVIPVQDKLNRAETILNASMEQYGETIKYLLSDDESVGTIVNATTGTTSTIHQADGYNPRAKRLFEFIAKSAGQFDPPSAENLLKIKADALANIALVAGISPLDMSSTDVGNVPSAAALRILSARRTATVRSFTTDMLAPALADLARILGLDARPVFADPTPHDMTEDLAHAQVRSDLGYTLEDNLKAMGLDPEDAAEIAANAANADARLGAAAVGAFRAGQPLSAVLGD